MRLTVEGLGFDLQIRIDEDAALRRGVDVARLVEHLRQALLEVPALPLTADPPRGREPASKRLVIDLIRRRVMVDSVLVELRYREHALLEHFARHLDETHDRRTLRFALEHDGTREVSDRTIDAYVQRLRSRIRPYDALLRTVHGRGYRLDQHPELTVIGG